MFEGDFEDCALKKFPLMSIGGQGVQTREREPPLVGATSLNKFSINFFPPNDVSIDSTYSIVDEKVKHTYVMKLACKYWSTVYNLNIKNTWKQRSMTLNARNLPGKFVSVPFVIKKQLQKNEIHFLTYEQNSFIKDLKTVFAAKNPTQVRYLVFSFFSTCI